MPSTPTPLRKAATRSLPMAYSIKRTRLAFTGNHTIATAATSSRRALGNHGATSVPAARLRNPSGAPPPGFSMISNATPPQMKPVVSVTTTSGMRDTTTVAPLIAPARAPTPRMPSASNRAWGVSTRCMLLAASTLATAICEPIERSMPPVTTAKVWAAAAKVRGSAPRASNWTSKAPKSGWMARVNKRTAASRSGIPTRPRLRRIQETGADREASDGSAWLCGRVVAVMPRPRPGARARARRAGGSARRPRGPGSRSRRDRRTSPELGRRRAGSRRALT